MDLPYEFVTLFLLKELIDYEHISRAVSEQRKDLIETYDTVGLIDGLICIASFRKACLSIAIRI